MNQTFLSGNLARDVELRFSPTGLAIAKFTIANNRKYKGTDGQLKEDVCWADVVAFGKTAEAIGKHFHKGSKILIQARLQTENWIDKQSNAKKSKLSLVAESFEFMDGKKVDGSDGAAPAPASAPADADDSSSVPF